MQLELGDKFIINLNAIHLLERGLKECLDKNTKMILSLESYQLNVDGEVCYDFQGKLEDGRTLRWLLQPDEVAQFLLVVNKGMERFILIDA